MVRPHEDAGAIKPQQVCAERPHKMDMMSIADSMAEHIQQHLEAQCSLNTTI